MMKLLIDRISDRVSEAFAAAGYDAAYGKTTLSNRPDLCEYQCNGCMPAAKACRKAPLQIAAEVASELADCELFEKVEAVKPGFLNFRISGRFLADYLKAMAGSERLGVEPVQTPRTVIVDYGGANVAKPLHVGHLRSAIIGESIKRIYRFFGDRAIGDVHLGDWGLQMGLVIEGLRERQPDLCYFDESYTGEYPEESPFTISDLEEIYPEASARSKIDEAFARRAHDTTYKLQNGDRGSYALWKHILRVSVADLKRNYDSLNVDFDLWLGESDAQSLIPDMLEIVRSRGLIEESDGAQVVSVQEPTDARELPPCILIKSDGATLYATTDLATILQRERDYRPDHMLYITDKRQALHFEQVFRVARKAGLIHPGESLQHIGFGTMNGKDGKPFKTRSGGVMRLERLVQEITDEVLEKTRDNQLVSEAALAETARCIALAALIYGDLSNQATKDYVFDLDRFSSFEGNTGPYLLYTIVRIKSILAKSGADAASSELLPAAGAEEKDLMRVLARLADSLRAAYRESAPHLICAYCYELATAANRFYHEVKILTEPDAARRGSYLALMTLTRRALEQCIALLGFSAPESM